MLSFGQEQSAIIPSALRQTNDSVAVPAKNCASTPMATPATRHPLPRTRGEAGRFNRLAHRNTASSGNFRQRGIPVLHPVGAQIASLYPGSRCYDLWHIGRLVSCVTVIPKYNTKVGES